MLKGEAKKTYQRWYMREYMRNLRSKQGVLRPIVKTSTPYAPVLELDADGNIIPEY